MQTVTVGRVGWVSREQGSKKHLNVRDHVGEQDEVQRFEQVCKRDTMTYDNRTEEIQPSRRNYL